MTGRQELLALFVDDNALDLIDGAVPKLDFERVQETERAGVIDQTVPVHRSPPDGL